MKLLTRSPSFLQTNTSRLYERKTFFWLSIIALLKRRTYIQHRRYKLFTADVNTRILSQRDDGSKLKNKKGKTLKETKDKKVIQYHR